MKDKKRPQKVQIKGFYRKLRENAISDAKYM
jgi:hypothetical protein